MKLSRLDTRGIAASFIASVAVMALGVFLCDITKEAGWVVRALTTGFAMASTAFAGFGAVHLMTLTRKHISVRIPKLFSGMTAVICVILFVFGALAQTGYSMRIKETTPEPLAGYSGCDIALLIDSSDSMGKRYDEVTLLAKALINATTENNNVVAACFTTQIDSEKPLTKIDDAAKKDLSEFVDARPRQGGTSLTRALEWADEKLKESAAELKTIIIISDGSSPVYPETADKIKSSGIKVYSVCLSGTQSIFSNEFVAFVKETGGFDTSVIDPENIAQLDPLVKEFGGLTSDIINVRGSELVFDDVLILYTPNADALRGPAGLVVLRLTVQFIFFYIYYLLMQIMFFRKLKPLSIVIGLGAAAVATAMVTLASSLSAPIISIVAVSLAIHTLFVKLKIEVKYYV